MTDENLKYEWWRARHAPSPDLTSQISIMIHDSSRRFDFFVMASLFQINNKMPKILRTVFNLNFDKLGICNLETQLLVKLIDSQHNSRLLMTFLHFLFIIWNGCFHDLHTNFTRNWAIYDRMDDNKLGNIRKIGIGKRVLAAQCGTVVVTCQCFNNMFCTALELEQYMSWNFLECQQKLFQDSHSTALRSGRCHYSSRIQSRFTHQLTANLLHRKIITQTFHHP